MDWRDEGILLALTRQGEGHAVLDAMTAAHGRWRGWLHGGGSSKSRLQPGDRLDLVWRARLEDQLGWFRAERLESSAARVLDDGEALAILSSLCAMTLAVAPERAPEPELYAGALSVLEALPDGPRRRAAYALWELRLLAAAGYGLDWSGCAMGGDGADLAWVSPATGRAAGRAEGAPWADRLLPLPAFLRDGAPEANAPDFRDALRLTGRFLAQRAIPSRILPPARERLEERANRAAP